MKLVPFKLNIKLLLAVMICLTVVYSSCRKSENKPASSAVDIKAQSGQIALNLAQSLAGNFGGVNIMDGVDSVSLTGHQGPHHGYNADALCGFYTDSVVNWNYNGSDTTEHIGGDLTFFFDCTGGKATGYTAYDSLNYVRTTSGGSNNSFVKQYYTIKCLTDNHDFIGVNGDIYYENKTITDCKCNVAFTNIENVNYVLKDLTVNVCGCSKDILSGTATFKAYGLNWSLTGTVTFLGNHEADVTINGVTYQVNLITHQIFVAPQ